MNSIAAATFLLFFCHFDSSSFPENEKLDCLDFMVNCMIDENGTNKTKTEQCKIQYIEGARYVEPYRRTK